MVLMQLLTNFEQFVATRRLCSNLPKCAATPQKTLKSAILRLSGNCCIRKSNGIAILWLQVHLGFYLTSAEPSAVTRGLCSNLPKFAALPRITKICHFQTNWQFLHKKNIGSSFMIAGAFMHIFHIC